MTVARWGNVCGSRSDAGWFITKPGVNLLAANLQADDFLFDSTWPKLGNVISAGQRSYVPKGISPVVTWPALSVPPLVLAHWRFAGSSLWRTASATAATGDSFTGALQETFYSDTDRLVFHANAGNTTTLHVRWRVYDRYTVPSGTPGAAKPRFLLDTTGLYITPTGITAKTAAAENHLIHPNLTSGQAIASGTVTANASGFASIPFNWSSYSGDFGLYAVFRLPGETAYELCPDYEELAGSVLRVAGASGGPVRWVVLK